MSKSDHSSKTKYLCCDKSFMNETSDYMEMREIPNKFLKNLTALKMLTNKSMKLVYFVLNEIKLQLHIALTFLLQILPKTLTFPVPILDEEKKLS